MKIKFLIPIVFFCLISIIFFVLFEKNKLPTPKKIMFIVHTETNGGKGVYALYKAMKETGHDVKIVAIPLYNGWYNLNVERKNAFLKRFCECILTLFIIQYMI